ncbi:MAG: STM4013/SEN3800 family hydrolase [Planctomycetes bacterium]|nr:STM4013/SEN3800 family hydrolase [Planctomycetota bacterium]
MNRVVGSHDIAFVVLDTLRFDVAERCLADGRTPLLKALLPGGRWEERQTPGNFTYAAHQAFFAGFLPTPTGPGPHPRLFAARFPGSESTAAETCVVDAPDWITGLRARGYRTICVGGVGFFNLLSPLGKVLPGLFEERHWAPELGVTDPCSTENQVALIEDLLSRRVDEPTLLYLNVSAIHQPNRHYLPGAEQDSLESQAAALEYVDGALGPLWEALRRRDRATLCLVCSDHGTAYGEDGLWGHRLNHPTVNTVPYAEFLLEPSA